MDLMRLQLILWRRGQPDVPAAAVEANAVWLAKALGTIVLLVLEKGQIAAPRWFSLTITTMRKSRWRTSMQ